MEETTHPTHTEPTAKQPSAWRSALSVIATIVLVPLLAIFLTTFVFQSYQVSGDSMQNTLQNGDRLLIWKGTRSWDRLLGRQYIPKRGDIVIVSGNNFSGCEEPSGDIVKRVIGLPGERVTYQNGRYTVYNASHPAGFDPDTTLPYGSTGTPEFSDPRSQNIDVTLGPNQLFISGDHRLVSCDSRIFGPVTTNQVVGQLALRIYPFSHIERF